MTADLPLDEVPRTPPASFILRELAVLYADPLEPVADFVTGEGARPVPRPFVVLDVEVADIDFDLVPAPVLVVFGLIFLLPAPVLLVVAAPAGLILRTPRLATDCGFARALGLFVAVAIRGSFIWEDFAIPIFVPSELPAFAVVRGCEAAAFSLFPLLPTGLDFSIASFVLDADFTLPPPVITADGFFKPPRALAVLFTGFTPGCDITASVLVLRVIAGVRFAAVFLVDVEFRVDAALVPGIRFSS